MLFNKVFVPTETDMEFFGEHYPHWEERHGAFWAEGYAQELVSGTEDSKEGMMSFVERRPPEFKGW